MDDVKEVFNKKRFLSSLDAAIKYSKISISKDVLYNFLNKSFQLREYLKFEYTKVISITLDMINHLAVILEISAYDLEYLTLDILKSGKNFLTNNDCRKFYLTYIDKSQKEFNTYEKLVQNQVIRDENDFYVIEHKIAKPNYITNKSIEGKILILDNIKPNISLLQNKIIMIESADPGYDWIFTHNIKGLITKYGGVG